MKVGLLTNIIPPYRLPLLRAIAREVDLTVILSAPMEPNRRWPLWELSTKESFGTVFLRGLRLHTGRDYMYLQPGVLAVLRRLACDVVITSGFSLNSLIAGLYARTHGKKALLWSEATPHTERGCSRARKAYRKAVARLHSAFIVAGVEARRYLLSLGVSKDRCFTGVDAVEDVRRRPDFAELETAATSIRAGLPGVILLYAGRLIPGKGVDHLLEAYRKICHRYEVCLVLMGEGRLEQQLREQVNPRQLPGVHFVGFKDEPEKWAYFLASDVFVFPTEHDAWGLVVNEAMLCGLPVVCSRFAGCAADLVQDDVNGYLVDPFDVCRLAGRLEALIADPVKRRAMSRESLERIAHYSIDRSAAGFLEAIWSVAPDAVHSPVGRSLSDHANPDRSQLLR